MSQILVSTITPCFRMKKYLKIFLEELPKQTMFERLQVIVDHNEPDEEEILWIRDFQSKYPGRLKHIIVNPVEVIGASMNRCIKEADGEFVTIWNVDDLRTDDSIEKQYKLLKDNLEVGVAYGNYIEVNAFGKTEGKNIEHKDVPESEFTRSMIWGPFVMFRKSLCEKAGYFDEQLTSGADFDLSIRLAFHTKAAMVHGSLGYYLNEGLGASTRPNSKQKLDRTVIELRYGIYDKMDYSIVPKTIYHDIDKIVFFGEQYDVANFVPNYKELMEIRYKEWFEKGVFHFVYDYYRLKFRTACGKIKRKLGL